MRMSKRHGAKRLIDAEGAFISKPPKKEKLHKFSLGKIAAFGFSEYSEGVLKMDQKEAKEPPQGSAGQRQG